MSPVQPAISSHTLFRSSVHSLKLSLSSLFSGSMLTSVRICPRISSSVPMPSTSPVSSLWNCAEAESHFSTLFPSSAFGVFTNSLPFFSSTNVKSVRAGTTAIPPPHVPKTAVICGITPDASVCFR